MHSYSIAHVHAHMHGLYLMTSSTSKYQLKPRKCFKCFTLDMKVYVGVEWNIGIIVARGHELDTWHGNKNANKKWFESS
jgi:hypothetical protein